MTFAWYGHLKYGHDWPLWQAIAVSWGIALFEYCLAVPANRLGFGEFTGFQLVDSSVKLAQISFGINTMAVGSGTTRRSGVVRLLALGTYLFASGLRTEQK